MGRPTLRLLGAAAAPAAVAIAVCVSSTAQAGPKAVVELFTSQACSSCPAADKLLGQLARDPQIVAMSLPITYWDYLGWKDTLAMPRHTARQRAYALMRGDRKVYTPQIVVDGLVHVVGNNASAIDNAIASEQKNKNLLAVPVTVNTADGKLVVSVPAQANRLPAEVWVCALSKAVSVPIGRGENKGRTVTYHNVVRRWVKLGEWTGDAHTWAMPLSDIGTDGVDAAAIIVQAGTSERPGPMLGAAMATLN